MILFSHPTGNQNARSVVLALAEANLLAEFVTTLAVFPGDALDRLSALPPLRELRRRCYEVNLRGRTRVWPWREAGRLLAARLAPGTRLLRHETGAFCIDQVYRSVDRFAARQLRRGRPAAIYAYEDGALACFQAARELGIRTFYDLPIGYWRAGHAIFREEAERAPAWAATLTGLRDSAEKLARKDEELALADRIYVASRFTAQTLSAYPAPLAPVEVVPYGFPPVGEMSPDWRPEGCKGGTLRVLFVGGLSQRKGLSDLFAAVALAGRAVSLTVVGHRAAECPALDAALAGCRWIPSLPHAEVLAEMRRHDVFVFPSLFEGFGLVLTEAMAQGMAVIATPHTAGPDLITPGVDGCIVPVRAPEAIAAQLLAWQDDREQLASVRLAARETAARRPWSVYGEAMVEAIRGVLS